MTPDELLDLAKTEFASDDPEVRARAVQRLLVVVRNHQSVRGEALAIFKTALESDETAWGALNAARGIELIAGREEGRRAWRRLLDHPRAEVVAGAAAVVDAALAPVLMDVLDRRAEQQVRVPVLHALGRTKYGLAYDPLVRALGDPELRPHAIEALADLGDARAVEHLTPLLVDRTEAWPEDNHGPMLRVRDLAKAAIARLGAAPAAGGPMRVMKDASAPNAGPRRLEPKASPTNPLAYLPIAAALVELPWFGIVAFAVLVTAGTLETTDAGTQMLDLISMSPAVLGLAGGAFAIARGGPKTTREKVCFFTGLILCGLFVFSFGWEFFHPHVPT